MSALFVPNESLNSTQSKVSFWCVPSKRDYGEKRIKKRRVVSNSASSLEQLDSINLSGCCKVHLIKNERKVLASMTWIFR